MMQDLTSMRARITTVVATLVSFVLAAVPIPDFAQAPGWHVTRHAAGHPSPCGAFAVAATLAKELPRPGECASLQSRNQNALRGENIVITAGVFGRQRWRKYPARRLPLRLERAPVHHCFEGIPCEFAYQELLARVHGWNLDVFVLYGRKTPAQALKNRAAAEVARLALG
jgi:hypothetical protein